MTSEASIDMDTLQFFAGHPAALPLYEALESRLRTLFPQARRRVQKTQITFHQRHVFLCVSCLRVKRKAELPDPWLVVTLGLPYPLASGRVAARSEPYPGRWTTHIVVGAAEELDDELFSWVEESYAFSQLKRGGRYTEETEAFK